MIRLPSFPQDNPCYAYYLRVLSRNVIPQNALVWTNQLYGHPRLRFVWFERPLRHPSEDFKDVEWEEEGQGGNLDEL